MKKEQLITLSYSLAFMALFVIHATWTPLIGVLFCLSLFAFLVSIQKPEVKPESASVNENSARGFKGLNALIELQKSEINQQNEAIKALSDRIGRAELATALRPGAGTQGPRE